MANAEAGRNRHDAEVVRAAGRLSLAMTGVCLYRATIRQAGRGWAKPWSWEIGVANPAARSVRVRHHDTEGSPVQRLAEAAVRKWPWLDDGCSPREPGPRAGAESIEIQRAQYYGGSDRWIDWSDMPCHGPARALWPLEAILGARTATEGEGIEVRGDLCSRYLTDVLAADAARLPEGTLVDPPRSDDDWRALTADVCIDEHGLVRRIAWSPTTGRRIKPGLLPRLAARVDKNTNADDACDPPGRPWHVTELWEYGDNVEIDAPTNLIDQSDTSMRDIVTDLWRMRRRYQREHRS
jgi:hypothetical protein